jgi:hypothetical protein
MIFNKITFIYGLTAGLGAILALLCFYYIDKTFIFKPSYFYSTLIPVIAAMWLAGSSLQQKLKLEFPTLLKETFLVFIISDILFYLFYYLLFNYFDTTLLAIEQQQVLQDYSALKTQTSDMEQIQALNQMIEQIEKNGLPPMTFGSVLIQLGRGVIGGFGLSYLVAYLLHKRNA